MDALLSLDTAALVRLVDRFYDKVRRDPELGPVFNAAVHDWDEHLRRLVSFWASVALRTGGYRGNPMAVHRALGGIGAGHFEIWLGLWRETARELLEPAAADLMIGHAERIGASLRLGMGLGEGRGRPLGLPVRGQAD
jgi:hemoglobin